MVGSCNPVVSESMSKRVYVSVKRDFEEVNKTTEELPVAYIPGSGIFPVVTEVACHSQMINTKTQY